MQIIKRKRYKKKEKITFTTKKKIKKNYDIQISYTC